MYCKGMIVNGQECTKERCRDAKGVSLCTPTPYPRADRKERQGKRCKQQTTKKALVKHHASTSLDPLLKIWGLLTGC